MKVYVVTSHLEYEGVCPETWVEGVFSSKEKAEEVMEEQLAKQKELNWGNINEKNIDEKHNRTNASLYDTCNSNYARIEIWEREVE